MKITEVAGGNVSTLRVRPISGELRPTPRPEDEVVPTYTAGQVLLTVRGDIWAVEGVTPADQSELIAVVTSGLPIIAFVAQASPTSMIVEARRFTGELRITEPMQIGLDEKVMEELHKAHGVSGTVADVARWVEDRLFVGPSPQEPVGLRRFVVAADTRGRLDAFRVFGLKISADVRRIGDRLRLERVVRGGRNGHKRMSLMLAPVAIVDATVTAELHGAARTTLAEAVSERGSYLRNWMEYHERERALVLRRARDFGAVEYRRRERRKDGGWRFHLAPLEDLGARLAVLGEWDRFELEAAETPPKWDGETAPDGPARKPAAKRQRLSASIVHIDERKSIVDLAPPDEDDDQPRPPEHGQLFVSLAGDEARLKRRARAEEALRTGNCPLPQLGLIMEGRPVPAARRSTVSVDGPRLRPVIREVFGATGPTQRQLEAIDRAINTPDVCLIQGPPGTGKTKVITAIERCLAELDEGIGPSQRILVSAAQHDAVENVAQRTEVFGLPAVKVGRRRGGSDAPVDPAQVFAEERLERLRARVRVLPEAERLSQARRLVFACCRIRSLAADQAARIRDIVQVLDGMMPPDLRDRALARALELERPVGAGDPEEAELALRAARSIRVDESTFSDDGPIQARKALLRLGGLLTPDERAFLERCAELATDQSAPWVVEGRGHRDAIIDRLTLRPPIAELRLDDETQRLLLEVLDTVERRLAATRVGDEAAIAAYLDDLETDLDGVRKALEHYTVVLAATLQQAAGGEMRRVRGVDDGQATFESVIVDEAARANPLDLFIPLSMAVRRVVLVGDHRQLPHLLEPDVEREFASGVDEGTIEVQTLRAIQASLFERLWVVLRALEQEDVIRRTVTLNAQYRMHRVLGEFVSREFYEIHDDGAIESPRDSEEFRHALPGYTKGERPCAAAWLDVPGDRGREARGLSKSRRVEAIAIAREVRRLIEHDSSLTFGVIAFYGAQVDEIGHAMMDTGLTERTRDARGWRVAEQWATTNDVAGKKVERLRIGTVDAFQGKEFDVVFLSVTRSNDLPGQTEEQRRRKYGHLMLENRLCVAMSRQQRMLVVVGDLDFVRADDAATPLRALRAFTRLCGGEYGVIR